VLVQVRKENQELDEEQQGKENIKVNKLMKMHRMV